jgi:hypothetical protein
VRGKRSDVRLDFCESIKKSRRIPSLWPERGNAQRMLRIELRKQLFSRVELYDRENKRVQHPRIIGSNILRLISQSWLECETTRREHSRIIDRLSE